MSGSSPDALSAPFPWWGGKASVASRVWRAVGADVEHYVEPFAGSLAVLLRRPGEPGRETVNDVDGLLCNFCRAVREEPDAVAAHADWPVNELDVQARSRWLMGERERITERLRVDPLWHDARAAGWWCWGQSASIMGNWTTKGGLNAKPGVSGHSDGRGVLRRGYRGAESMRALAARLRRVRVLVGDFERVVTDAVLFGDLQADFPVAVFLDPPYRHEGRDDDCDDDCDDPTAAPRAAAWAVANGDNPRLRIVLCGYEGDFEPPPSWRTESWQAHGGMANRAEKRGKANRKRERLWFSPHCLSDEALPLFARPAAQKATS